MAPLCASRKDCHGVVGVVGDIVDVMLIFVGMVVIVGVLMMMVIIGATNSGIEEQGGRALQTCRSVPYWLTAIPKIPAKDGAA
jgi:hypothetical protein